MDLEGLKKVIDQHGKADLRKLVDLDPGVLAVSLYVMFYGVKIGEAPQAMTAVLKRLAQEGAHLRLPMPMDAKICKEVMK